MDERQDRLTWAVDELSKRNWRLSRWHIAPRRPKRVTSVNGISCDIHPQDAIAIVEGFAAKDRVAELERENARLCWRLAAELDFHRSFAVHVETLEARLAEAQAENERLTHLHNLDHSLANQWEAKNVEIERRYEALRKAVERYLNASSNVYGGLAAAKEERHARETVAQLAAQGDEPVSPWRPIATAPKSRNEILIYVPENKCIYAVFWKDWGQDQGWFLFGGGLTDRDERLQRATLWTPLPGSPQSEIERGEASIVDAPPLVE